MVLQVCIADTVYCKSFVILHALSIGNRVLAVEREVEVEVRIFLLQFPEVLKEEGFTKRTSAIEEVKLTVARVKSLGNVHDLSTQRSHTCTTTNPDHLLARCEVRMEVAIRT